MSNDSKITPYKKKSKTEKNIIRFRTQHRNVVLAALKSRHGWKESIPPTDIELRNIHFMTLFAANKLRTNENAKKNKTPGIPKT